VTERAQPTIRLENITKTFGDFVALKGIDLQVDEGEFVTLLGASGSGKTTCLRIVAGFTQPDTGRVFIAGKDITSVPPYRRDTGMVFQHFALFPHMTVERNVAYGLMIRRLPRAEIAQRTAEALKLVQLDMLAKRYPAQLSGGQRQRVALARAIVIRPKVLLFDEPLGALDLKLREELQVEIKRVQQAVGITTINVTHDQGEALSMSDRVVVMAQGRILQVDSPTALYQRPNSVYVANFVGRTNLLRAKIVEVDADGGRFRLRLDGHDASVQVNGAQAEQFRPGDDCLVAFRPEDTHLQGDLDNRADVVVQKVVYKGTNWLLTCSGPDDQSIFISVPSNATVPGVNDRCSISWSPANSRLLKLDIQHLPS